MQKPPRVSVVMPTYQQGRWIEEAVDSVINQSFTDAELIVVLDGPHDAVTERTAHRADRVLVHSTNMGTAKALNTGFAEARGEYLTWVSSDNVMLPNWLERLAEHLDTTSDGAVYSSYIELRDNRKPRERRRPPKPLIDSQACFIGPSFLYRREFHHEHRGRISHDYDWWLRFEEKAKIGWVDDILACYRIHPDRVTTTRRHEYDAPKWQARARERRS